MSNDKEKQNDATDKTREPNLILTEMLLSMQTITMMADEYFGINSVQKADHQSDSHSTQH